MGYTERLYLHPWTYSNLTGHGPKESDEVGVAGSLGGGWNAPSPEDPSSLSLSAFDGCVMLEHAVFSALHTNKTIKLLYALFSRTCMYTVPGFRSSVPCCRLR